MPSTKKTVTDKHNQSERQAQQHPTPSSSLVTATSATPGPHENLRAQLNIPAHSDTRGPPAVQYQTAHREPTWSAAQCLTSEPHRVHSAATLAPHLLPPSRNGIYPTMVVNDFYESITVNTTSTHLPPVPKVPLRTNDIQQAFFELSADYKTLAMPSVPIQRQPRRQNYFLERDDLLMCDYMIEFRNHNTVSYTHLTLPTTPYV